MQCKSSSSMDYLFESQHSPRPRAPNERQCDKGTKGHEFFQRFHTPPSPSSSMYERSHQHSSTKFDTRVSGYINPTAWRKQVYLYQWYLTRVGGDHPENGNAQNGGQVALEGYTTSDLLDHKKFRTAPIESRIEKCKLRTVDGLYIQLMGAIDEQCTYNNGFPIPVIHFFLTGFPFNWNQLISTCYSQPSLNTSALPASKEKEYAWQEKDETLKYYYSGIHMEDMGAGKSSLLEPKEKMSKLKENVSKVTSPRESSVRCSKRGRHGSQPIQSSKQLKCDNLRKKREPKVFSPFVGLPENANVSKESGCKLPLGSDTASVKTEEMTPEKMYLGTETHDRFDRDDVLTESGSKLLRKSLNFSVSQEDEDSVEGKKSAMKYRVFRSMKETSESKKQIDCESLLVEAKSAQTVHPVTKESGSENQTNGHFFSAEDNVHQQIDKNEAKQLPTMYVYLEQFENNCTSGEITLKNQITVSESPDTNFKTGKSISRDRSHTNRNGTNKSSHASRGELCGEITEVAVRKMSDAEHETHCETVISRRALGKKCKNFTQSPSNPEFRVTPSKIISSRTDGKGQLESDCSAVEAIDFDIMCMKEDVLYVSAENKTSSLPGKNLNNAVNRPVKQANMSGLKRGELPKNRTRCTDQPCELSNAFVCNHITVNDGVMLKSNDMDATCGSNRYQVSTEIEHGMASKHHTEICDDNIQMKEDVVTVAAENYSSSLPENKSSSLPENYLNSDVNKPVKQVNRSGTRQKGRPKKETLHTDQSPLSENKSSSLSENNLNSDVNKHVKQVNRSGTRQKGRPKKGTLHTDQSPEPSKAFVCSQTTANDGVNRSGKRKGGRPKKGTLYTDQSPEPSKAFVCSQTTANDGVMLKRKDIDATCGTNPYQVASEIKHGMASKHYIENGDNCRERNGDGEEGSVKTPNTITEINMRTQTSKRQLVDLQPLPPRRVHTTPEEVSKAFGLKISRSGRLLIPPLAYWCNQKVAYDLDRGLIAIFDASSQRNTDN
ncbi:hypothetical protein KI387_001488, partial [Taxus chinensis]